MNRQTIYSIIFNAVGILIGLAIVGYIVNSAFITETEPSCTKRYPAPIRLPLRTAEGAPLTPIELQTRAGLREWGVMENATVVTAAQAPTGTALQIKLNTVEGIDSNERAANGVHFRWSPSGLNAAASACLSYSLWLPDDFAFSNGGTLPGILGSQTAPAEDGSERSSSFGTQPQWMGDAKGVLTAAMAGAGYQRLGSRSFSLPAGRWIRIELELVLNAPGEPNGTARVWIDGQLQDERHDLPFRTDESGRLTGVLADVGYFSTPENAGLVRLSPFELSWK